MSEKPPLPRGYRYHSGSFKSNGIGYSNGFANHHHHPQHVAGDEPISPRSPTHRLKAFTQHAASPRHRPPVTFYTIRTDPRDMSAAPGAFPMAPPHPYRAPPPVGRPVFFLDWKPMSSGKRRRLVSDCLKGGERGGGGGGGGSVLVFVGFFFHVISIGMHR